MPKKNWSIRVKDALQALHGEQGQHLQLVESVCTVERLSQVLQAGFNTIPVANMHGSIIGMVPKNFVVILIENQMFYENSRLSRAKTMIPDAYKTSRTRASN